MASEWEEINKTRTEKVTQKKFIKISKSLGRKWNKMSDTLKQKFKKSKPEAVEPETKPADIQPEKEPVVQNRPESIVEPPTEVQPIPTTEEESSVKPEVPKDVSELASEPSELSDLIGRSNVGSAINLPKTADPEPAEEEIQEQEASEENTVDEVVADGTTDEIIADGSVIEEATGEENAVAEEVVAEVSATEDVNVEAGEAIVNLNEMKSFEIMRMRHFHTNKTYIIYFIFIIYYIFHITYVTKKSVTIYEISLANVLFA